jgi:PKD repeat protein
VITSWLWEFEPYQYSTSQNPVYQYYAVDSCYGVKLIVTDFRGCIDTVDRQVCVPAPLAITFDYQKECFGTPTQFVPQIVTPTGDSLISFSWNFGDPASGSGNNSTTKKPSHLFTKTGFYTVSLTAVDMFGCSASSIQNIQINALPVADFTYVAGQCDSTVTFTSTSVDTSALITTYIWNYGDGTADTVMAPNNSILHKFHAQGTFIVKLTVINTNGCSDEQTIEYKLNPCLIAAFENNSQTGCENTLLSFSDMSISQGTIAQWEWNWGDNSPATVYNTYTPVVTHMFTKTGVFKVELKVTTIVNGSPYSDSTSKFVTILTSPVAEFTSNGSCAGSRTNFFNTTSTSGVSINSYNWNFGDPVSDKDTANTKNSNYIYSVAGEFEATLVVTNQLGCSDTVTHNIQINGLPTADYNFSVACLGHPTHFFDQSDPYIAELTNSGWVISSNLHTIGYISGQNATFIFDSLGVYSVIHGVSDSNGCSDSVEYQITVVPSPLSVFNINDNFEEIQGKLQLENGSIGADEYSWEFGNGETSNVTSPIITYNEDGDYLITLYAKNDYGCVDSSAMLYKMLFKGLWVPNAMAVGPVSETRLWKPVGINLSYYSAEIYNRWGELIWSSTMLTEKGEPVEGWDGTFKDVPCKQGVYVWKITAIFRDGSVWQNDDVGNREGLSEGKAGTITIIR